MRAGLLACTLALTACSGSNWYDAQVQIMRVIPVQLGEGGAVLDVDVRLEYPECPGHQVEVIRGDAPFATCMQRYEVGATVAARIEHQRSFLHHSHDWDVHQVGDCERTPDPDDESSYDTVEECEVTMVNGVQEGFLCNHVPHAALLRACPWFERH